MDTRTQGDTGNNIDNHFEDCGFTPVAPEDRVRRSCYFSPTLQCRMIVYVDDFEISGPRAGVTEARRLIRGPNPRAGERGIILDEPTPAGKFLGCNHECSFGWAPPMRTDSGSVQPLEGVRRSENDTRVQYSAVIPGTEANAQGDPASGVFDPTAGNVCYKQIKYDVSDFLGSCVRLCQELTSTQGVPLKPALTPFIDETGDDYGLGVGVCEETPDDPMVEDARVDMERTLQELAQNACVGMERTGYFTYGCNYEDGGVCHASIYANFTSRRVPYSKREKEGAVPTESVRARRAGRISVETIASGAYPPTKSATQRAGLTLRSMELVEIQPGRSVSVATGLRLLSFRGQREYALFRAF
jgi:hypothetical protein